jgi:hypothetical protein
MTHDEPSRPSGYMLRAVAGRGVSPSPFLPQSEGGRDGFIRWKREREGCPMAKREPAITPVVPESAILAQCLAWLAFKGIPSWRANCGAMKRGDRFIRMGQKGQPDIMGILPGGVLLCCECKRQGGKLSEDQRAWLERAKAAGAVTVVAHSVEELARAIEERGA